MRISLQREAGAERLPVYRQIAEQIRLEIEAEKLAVGSRLPPIRDLAKSLRVHRDTVALAYEALAQAGMVESTVGRGTFVRASNGVKVALAADFQPELSPIAEKLLELERSRPRFGSSGDAVAMHSLVPDPALYPADAFRRVLNRVLSKGGASLLLYGGPGGHPRMREVMAGRLRDAGVEIDADGIVLCHGASQGISLAMRLFARHGRRGRSRGAHLSERAVCGDGARPAHGCDSDARGRPRSRHRRTHAAAPRGEGAVHDSDLSQPARHDHAARPPTPAARDRGALRQARDRGCLRGRSAFCGQTRGIARGSRYQRPRGPAVFVLEVAVPGRPRRRDCGAGARASTRCSRSSRRAIIRTPCRCKPRSRSSWRPATTTATSRGCAACCSRAAMRCWRRSPSTCPRARAGRRRRAATRSGWSCPRESTRGICSRTPSAPACSSRRAPSSTTTGAPRAVCGFRLRW